MANSQCVSRSQLYLQYLLALDMMGEDGALEHNPEVAGGHTAAGDPECLACVVVP